MILLLPKWFGSMAMKIRFGLIITADETEPYEVEIQRKKIGKSD